jgi:hypothetical protein
MASPAVAGKGLLGSVASSLGKELASGAAGDLGSFGFGQIMTLAGIDLSGQREVEQKLDEILQAVQNLAKSVEDLKADMDTQLSALKYNVAYTSVQRLVADNAFLGKAFASLLKAGKQEADNSRIEIDHYIAANLLAGPDTWHQALSGLGGQTGLLEAWSKAVFQKASGWFGPSQAKAIQDQWDYFDSQQALTVNYLVEHYNLNKEPQAAKDLLRSWAANRRAQIFMLRGAQRRSDTFTTIDDAGRATEVGTGVKILPPCTLIRNSLMWCLAIPPRIQQFDNDAAFNGAADQCQRMVEAVTLVSTSDMTSIPVQTWWRIYDVDTMIWFMQDCGAALGGGSDNFQAAMQRKGFVFQAAEGLPRFWTTTQRSALTLPPQNRRVALNEGREWSNPEYDINAQASLLFGRPLTPGESDNYWYS